MGCSERKMGPANRSGVGILATNRNAPSRYPDIWRFIGNCLEFGQKFSTDAGSLEDAYVAYTGNPRDRSTDLHNLSEFLLMIPSVEECKELKGRQRRFLFGVRLRPESDS